MLKNLSILLSIMIFTSCTWIATHPQEDAEILLSIEKLAERAYEYESKALSPMPPQPHTLYGPTGPKVVH